MIVQRRLSRNARGDEGSISVLSLGWVVVVLVAALVVAVASDIHVQRVRLAALADTIVLDAVGAATYGYFDLAPSSPVTADAVEAAAHRHTGAGAASVWATEVWVAEAAAPDSASAQVTVERVVPLAFGLDALAPWSDGVVISASATARAS